MVSFDQSEVMVLETFHSCICCDKNEALLGGGLCSLLPSTFYPILPSIFRRSLLAKMLNLALDFLTPLHGPYILSPEICTWPLKVYAQKDIPYN